MKDIDTIKARLKQASEQIERALKYIDTNEVGYAAEEVDLATEELMSAYAIAREYIEE